MLHASLPFETNLSNDTWNASKAQVVSVLEIWSRETVTDQNEITSFVVNAQISITTKRSQTDVHYWLND